MFKIIQKLTVCVIIFFAAFSNANAKPVLDIQHWQTKNGAKVYFVEAKQLPMLDIRLVFAAGSSRDGDSFGLASMTNSLIGQGSEHLTADQIADQFDAVGASFSSQAGRDQASISLRTLSKESFLNPALKTFIEVASHANFSEDSIVRAKNSADSAIKSQQQDPGAMANNVFYETLFKNTHYAHNPIGTEKTNSEITRGKMQDFYHRFYSAKNMQIILVGDISKESAAKLSDEIANAFPAGEPAPVLSHMQDTQKSDLVKLKFPAGQTSLMIGQVGISRKDPDYFPLNVGNTILGGSSQTSLLFTILRNQNGLVYFANSQFLPMLHRGPFIISLKTKNQQVQEALSLVRKTVREYIKNGPSETQLAAAKKNMIGLFPMQISTNSNILEITSAIAFYGLPLNYLDTYRANVQAVTADEIKKAFDKHVKPEHFIVVSVGGEIEKK